MSTYNRTWARGRHLGNSLGTQLCRKISKASTNFKREFLEAFLQAIEHAKLTEHGEFCSFSVEFDVPQGVQKVDIFSRLILVGFMMAAGYDILYRWVRCV